MIRITNLLILGAFAAIIFGASVGCGGGGGGGSFGGTTTGGGTSTTDGTTTGGGTSTTGGTTTDGGAVTMPQSATYNVTTHGTAAGAGFLASGVFVVAPTQVFEPGTHTNPRDFGFVSGNP